MDELKVSTKARPLSVQIVQALSGIWSYGLNKLGPTISNCMPTTNGRWPLQNWETLPAKPS